MSIIRRELIPDEYIRKTGLTIHTASGRIRTEGVVTLWLHFGEDQFQVEALVLGSDMPIDILLGQDFLVSAKVILNFSTGQHEAMINSKSVVLNQHEVTVSLSKEANGGLMNVPHCLFVSESTDAVEPTERRIEVFTKNRLCKYWELTLETTGYVLLLNRKVKKSPNAINYVIDDYFEANLQN